MHYTVVIVQPPGHVHSQAFAEVAESVACALKTLGHEVSRSSFIPNTGKAIVFGSNLLSFPSELPASTIIYNLEQTDTNWMQPDLIRAFQTHETWDYSASNIERLKQRNVFNVKHVPIGYVPELTRIYPKPENIDLLFYGALSDRRIEILDRLAKRWCVKIVPFGIYGADRDDWIAQSKVVLNLHYYRDNAPLEAARVVYLLANRKAVVSEDSTDADEFEGSVLFSTPERLEHVCETVLKNAALRKELGEAGFRYVSNQRNVVEYLRAVL